MGRGLSELQKQILVMAHHNCVKENIRPHRHAVALFVSRGQSVAIDTLWAVPPSSDSLWPPSDDLEWLVARRAAGATKIGHGIQELALFDCFAAAQTLCTYLRQYDLPVDLTWEWPIKRPDDKSRQSQASALWNYEVLWHCFGFAQYAIRPYYYSFGGRRGGGCAHFDPDRIGRARYDAAKASVSRAIKRLAERHLVFDHNYGCHLTPEGATMAAHLAQSIGLPDDDHHKVNR